MLAMGEKLQKPFTEREEEVAQLLAQGLTSKEIGRHLDISPRTVDVHRCSLLAKSGVRNIGEFVRYMLHGGQK